MGLFSKEECCVCSKKTNSLNRLKMKDGYICGGCCLKCSQSFDFPDSSISDLQKHLIYREENEQIFSKFTPTFSIKPHIYIDYNKKEWYVPSREARRTPDILSFNDLVNFEYIEDGNVIVKSKGGVGRAIVGGILFGDAGAVVGSNTAKSVEKQTMASAYIRISLKNKYMGECKIELLNAETKKEGFIYKAAKTQAESIISNLERIRSEQEDCGGEFVAEHVAVTSSADEILKYKQLLDSGIITRQEFDAKKRLLLGL